MRRRVFFRVCAVGLGPLAFGCQGRLWSERARSSDAGPSSNDAGREPRLLPDEDGGPRADGGPGRPPDPRDAGSGPTDAGGGSPLDSGGGDCPERRTVTIHDTHAQALYFDGTYGPKTGVVSVDDIVAGGALDLEFWHGHGGSNHRFVVQAADLEALARGERVMLTTTEVDSHMHMLFIDPVGEEWRAGPDRSAELC